MRPRVLVTRSFPGNGLDRLAAIADVSIHADASAPGAAVFRSLLEPCDAAIIAITERVDADVLAAASRLRAVSNVAVGTDNIDVAACTARTIQVGNTPGVLTDATADLTMALLLAVQRRLFEAAAAVRNGAWPQWQPTWMCGTELAGQVLGIVGNGAIGKAVARRAEAFGMQVLTSSRSSGVPLEELLQAADVVSLHCPLTAETRHLIGAPQLAMMKPSAVLINTARGAVVDQQALASALRDGTIRAAGLDVAEVEPMPIDDPLLQLANCLVLPHIGSATIATRTRMFDLAVDNIVAALEGRAMPNLVNPDVL